MANPQLENGHIEIANEIWDAICHIRISGEARQVLDCILRKTYGFRKKIDGIPLSQFYLVTGMKKTAVLKAIKKLESMNLIGTKKGTQKWNLYAFNKDFSTWKPVPKKVTVPKKVPLGTKKGTLEVPKKGHSKDNVSKDNVSKDNNTADFEKFWEIYPRKENKAKAKVSFSRIGHPEIEKVLEGVVARAQFWADNKTEKQFIPHPTTWLNGRRWEDDLSGTQQVPKFSHGSDYYKNAKTTF